MRTHGALTLPRPPGAQRPRAETSDDMDFRAMGFTLWRHKAMVLGVLACSLLGTAAFVSRSPEMFEAESLVTLNGGQPQPTSIPGTSPSGAPNGTGLSNQILLITSNKMAGKLVDRMNLPPARRVQPGSP